MLLLNMVPVENFKIFSSRDKDCVVYKGLLKKSKRDSYEQKVASDNHRLSSQLLKDIYV